MAKKVSKEKIRLQVEKRKVLGRKVKRLRREGILPANIYGKKVKSLAVQVNLESFLPVFKQTGETGLVELKIKGEQKVRPVLIHNVQFNPVSDQPLHADFYQVDLKQKVTTEVPIETVGESLAVKEKSGVLVQPLTEVEVEALPTNLPDKFEVNIGQLKEIGETITVGDLKAPAGVKILTGAGEVLAKVEAPTKEEEEVAAPAPAEEVALAAEGEVPAEKGVEKAPAEGKREGKPSGAEPAEKSTEEGKAEKPAKEQKVEKEKKKE